MHEIISTLQEFWQTAHQNGLHSLGPLSYVLIALLVATEGPITTLIGAGAAAAGMLDIRFVFLATAIGNIAGDALWYTVGYASKSDRLHRLTGRFGVRKQHIERLEEEMRVHAAKAILIAKITFGLIIPTLVAAGLARVSLRKWLPAVLVAETVWSILLVSLGYRAAGAIAQIENGFRVVGLVAAVATVILMVLYLRRKHDGRGAVSVGRQTAKRHGDSPHTGRRASTGCLPQAGRQHRRSPSTMTPSVRTGNQILEKA